MKVLITDDEPLARQRLHRLVTAIPGAEVAGEAGNGHEALALSERLRPDVVLLDIRMPGLDGLETALHLGASEPAPAVIFTTAYGDHALAAFEANAVDYLLKPIRRDRLQQALARAHSLNRAQLEATRRLDGAAARSHLAARSGARLKLIPVGEVIWLRADHKYVTVRHDGGELLVEESLKALEAEFGARFVRIHRNCLVASDRIRAIERRPDGVSVVGLDGCDDRLEISRRHLSSLRERFRRSA